MKKYQFKTNIMCGGCIAAVTPFLEKEPEISNWKVDLESTDKVLTVESSSLSEDAIQSILKKAGYKAEVL